MTSINAGVGLLLLILGIGLSFFHLKIPLGCMTLPIISLNAGEFCFSDALATVNKDIRTLKRIFNLAIAPRGYLPPNQNPFASIRQRKHSLKSIRYVTPQEFHKLLAAANDAGWKALLTVAYIKTTQTHYLSVQPRDLETARQVQSAFLTPQKMDDATDQLASKSGFSPRKSKRPNP